ncbi:unnamed protein product, partial [marine sediment metagenome]
NSSPKNPGNLGNPSNSGGSSQLLQETSQRDFLKSVSEFRAAGYEFLGFSVSNGTYRALVFMAGGHVPRGVTLEEEKRAVIQTLFNQYELPGKMRWLDILLKIKKYRYLPDMAAAMVGVIGEEAEYVAIFADLPDDKLDKWIKFMTEAVEGHEAGEKWLAEMKKEIGMVA